MVGITEIWRAENGKAEQYYLVENIENMGYIFFVENIKKMRNIISWKTFPAESCPLKVPPGSRMGRKSLG